MMDSERFDQCIYTDPARYEERPLRDRKAWLDFSPEKERLSRAEFVKDVIAMANTARQAGRPGYLIFGLDNDGNVCGVSKTLEHLEGGARHPRRWEILREKLGNWIEKGIGPSLPEWQLEHSDDLQGQPVFYVKVAPVVHPRMYRVKQDWPPGREKLVRRGQCWIRIGESNRSIPPDTHPYSWTYDQVPYVLPSTWQGYFSALVSDTSALPEAYQDLYASSGRSLDDEVNAFLAGNTRVLVIEGEAGCGKTVFLKKWVYEQSQSMADAAQETVERNEYDWHPAVVPVFFTLRSFVPSSQKAFTNALIDHCHRLSSFWQDHRPRQPERLFENTKLKWVICLDGLDEIWSDPQREGFIGLLLRFIERYAHIKVVLTTRPDIAKSLAEHGGIRADVVRVFRFAMEQVENYVATRLNQNERGQYIEDVMLAIRNEADFQALCRIPLFLSVAVETLSGLSTEDGEGVELPLTTEPDARPSIIENNTNAIVPDGGSSDLPKAKMEDIELKQPIADEARKTVMDDEQIDENGFQREPLPLALDHIYRRLWNREKSRRAGHQRLGDPLWERTGRLALRMDGRNLEYTWDEATRVIRSYKSLNWLLNLGVLRSRQGWLLQFSTDLTKVYFAAAYLKEVNRSTLWQQCVDEFKAQVCRLLAELKPDSLFLETEVEHGNYTNS